MDLTSIIGFILGFGMLEVGYLIDGGDASKLWLLSAFIMVVGGGAGALIMSFGMNEVKKFPILFLEVFLKPKSTVQKNIELLVRLSESARKEGLLSLEKQMETEKKIDSFLQRGILMVVDGTDSAEIISLMENEITVYEQQKKLEISMFDTFAAYAPAMGMIGTIIGLVQVLQDMSSPEKMGKAIAVAFLTTLYGVLLANLFFIPGSTKLKARLSVYCTERQMIIEGVCAIRDGINPKMLRDKLSPYLLLSEKAVNPKAKQQKQPGKEEPKAAKGKK